MTAQGKANYDGYRAAAMGKSLITGAPLPEWEDLSYLVRLAWDCAATSAELWLAEAAGDQDAAGEPDSVAARVLDLEIGGNDSGAATVRGYLLKLLATLWREEQGFSGKRPFGNSGWQYDLYRPLVGAGLIRGTLDEDGYLAGCDVEGADVLILAAIAELGMAACTAGRDRLRGAGEVDEITSEPES